MAARVSSGKIPALSARTRNWWWKAGSSPTPAGRKSSLAPAPCSITAPSALRRAAACAWRDWRRTRACSTPARAGTIRIDGDFTNTALGTVSVAVLGDLPQQYGRVEVGGTAHLGGTLNLSLSAAVLPEVARRLSFLAFDGREGAFVTVNGLSTSFGSNGALRGNGAGLAPGWVDQAFTFDGANDYVEIPDSSSLHNGGPFTVEFWVKPDAHRSSGLITHYDNAINGPGWGFNYYGTDGGGSKKEYAMFIIETSYSNYTYLETPEWRRAVRQVDAHRGNIRRDDDASVPQWRGDRIRSLRCRSATRHFDPDWRAPERRQQGTVLQGRRRRGLDVSRRALTADEIRAIFDAGSAGKGTTPSHRRPPDSSAGGAPTGERATSSPPSSSPPKSPPPA
jgi:hypothetical protein